MAKRRDRDEDMREMDEGDAPEMDRAPRRSPYDQMASEDAYDDVYDETDDDFEEDGGADSRSRVTRGKRAGRGSLLGGMADTAAGKALLAVIALLAALLIGLLLYGAVRGLRGGGDPNTDAQGQQATGSLPQGNTSAPVVFEPAVWATDEPDEPEGTPQSVIFAPVVSQTSEPTQEPTQAPTATPTPQPTATPEPTDTPLPIILTNTPTPSPSPTPTASPSPTPEPTPSPTPSPSPVPDLAKGETNREANLRESAKGNAKVKEKVKKGQAVTIHETLLDSQGRVWYALTVDDLAADGFMRDYVVDVEGELEKPTATPKADATPAPGESAAQTQEKSEATPAPQGGADVLGTGKTNRDANIRKIMNGKVTATLRKNKRVSILDVRADKKGNVWYHVQVEGGTTVGFMRDYVVTLDEGVTLPTPEGAATPTPAPEATPESAAQGEAIAEGAEATPAPQDDDILSREVFGKARTNREANVRSVPKAGGKVVRQLSKGLALQILDQYETGGDIWYEVATESGKTHGFVRDYVIDILEIDGSLTAKTYEGK